MIGFSTCVYYQRSESVGIRNCHFEFLFCCAVAIFGLYHSNWFYRRLLLDRSTMGSSISTIVYHVSRLDISNDTLLGLVLALPFFITYMTEAIDLFASTRTREKSYITEEDNEMIVKTKTLFCGEMQEDDQTSCSTSIPQVAPKNTQAQDDSDASSSVITTSLAGSQQSSPSTPSKEKAAAAKSSGSGECYLERIARGLYKKSKESGHSDKVGISDALVQLCCLLAEDKKTLPAIKVLMKTEKLQKKIITETILSVASAMKKQSSFHKNRGQDALARIYLETAAKLKKDPSATSLKHAWSMHAKHKKRIMNTLIVDEDLRDAVQKVERRLKRASTEAAPLAKTLTMLAKIKKTYYNEQEEKM